MKTKLTPFLLAALLGVASTARLHAAPLNPTNFTSLGTLDLSNGTFVIDTDALTISETNATSTNVLFTGVIDDQGGRADSFGPGTNVTAIGSNGIPYITVFTFDSIHLASNAVISVTGHRALALLSQGAAEIDTTLALNAQAYTNTPGPGGFPGAEITASKGQGPGGGGTSVRFGGPNSPYTGGAGGGFGAAGVEGDPFALISGGVAGPAYGDPFLSVLQGGSGGGAALFSTNYPQYAAEGGGGGGALEIGAVEQLDLGASGHLEARGGVGQTNFTYPAGANLFSGGFGSGGGILLFGQPVTVEGTVDASCSVPHYYFQLSDGGVGGGGRIALFGYQIPGITGYLAGVNAPPNVSGAHFIVANTSNNGAPVPGTVGINGYGAASSGWHVVVNHANPLQLGSVTQLIADTNYMTYPNLYLVANGNDITVWGGSEATFPTNGFIFDGNLKLSGLDAQIAGPGALINRGLITGEGQVQSVLVNDSGGRISTIKNTLAFADAVTNEPGGKISAIGATLNFNGGLDNLGALNLINTTVAGTVVNNGTTSLAGTSRFAGLVSGAGNFSGAGTAQFDGTYSPGNCPAAVIFTGNVAFSPAATLRLELGGTNAGSQYDQLNVRNQITFGGTLDVVLINGFVPAVGEVFHLINAGARLGAFTSVSLPALPRGLVWQNHIATDGTLSVVAQGTAADRIHPTVLRNGSFQFNVMNFAVATNDPQRFYRVVSP